MPFNKPSTEKWEKESKPPKYLELKLRQMPQYIKSVSVWEHSGAFPKAWNAIRLKRYRMAHIHLHFDSPGFRKMLQILLISAESVHQEFTHLMNEMVAPLPSSELWNCFFGIDRDLWLEVKSFCCLRSHYKWCIDNSWPGLRGSTLEELTFHHPL